MREQQQAEGMRRQGTQTKSHLLHLLPPLRAARMAVGGYEELWRRRRGSSPTGAAAAR
eukprot:gene13477-40010_t